MVDLGLALAGLVAPLVMLAFAGDPSRIDLEGNYQGPSGAHPFGTDSLGRDIFGQVARAWWGAVLVGTLAGLGAFLLGLAWRSIAGHRVGAAVEAVLLKLPPAVVFVAALGIAISLHEAPSWAVAVACASVLLPQSLRLARTATRAQLHAAASAVVMLGVLLSLGWSFVLTKAGLLSSSFASFTDPSGLLLAPWTVALPALVFIAGILGLLGGLTLLGRTYDIPRDLLRLRG